jgi:hypothetical protein
MAQEDLHHGPTEADDRGEGGVGIGTRVACCGLAGGG